MCDVTDVRSKVPTDWSKFSPPQDVHFLTHFCFDRNEITLRATATDSAVTVTGRAARGD